MSKVKNMSEDDFAFAVNITDTMDWNLVEDDFKFMMTLEPEGCFVLLNGSERVGIVTTVSFGKIGWIGNLIVSENYRKKGAGAMLVRYSLDYLTNKTVETVGLYAYIDTIHFYRRIGFEYDSEFVVFQGTSFSSPVRADVREIRIEDVRDVIDFDGSCFGASRKKLLEPILRNSNNLCYMSCENGQIVGYAAAKVYDGIAELGPLVCLKGHNDVAAALLKATLKSLDGYHVSMCIPRKESMIYNLLKASGFSESFPVARMFFGYPSVEDCIYMAESLERG
jgi:GNAT superfamily N-acetyltransferase